MHACNVDVAPAKYASDRSNDAGFVVVREEDHVPARHDLQRIAIDVHDPRKLVREHSSRNPVRFYVCLEFDQNEVCKILRRRYARLLNPDATLFCDVHRVDQVHTFTQDRHKEAPNNQRGQVIQIHVANFTGVSDRYRLHSTGANLGDKCRQTRRQIHKVLIPFDGACLQTWEIQSTVHCVLQQVIRNLPANVFGNSSLRFYGRRPKMRSRYESLQLKERRFRIRLDLKHIECGTCHLSRLQSIVEIEFVDNAASGAIDKAHAVLHASDRVLVDEVSGGVTERNMNGNEIRLFENIFDFDEFEAAGKVSIRIDVRVVSDDVHAHRLALPRDLASDAAQPDHAERLACKLHSFKFAFLPLPAFQSDVSLRNISGERKEHGNCMFRGCRRGSARRVHHQNSAFRGRVEINVIHTYAGATDNLQAIGLLHQLTVDNGAAADDDPIRVSHDTHQFVA